GKAVHIVPHRLVVGVEDVGPVAVDMDALHLFGVDVAGNVVPLVDDETLAAGLCGLVGEHRAEQPGADDQVIIRFCHTGCLPPFARWIQSGGGAACGTMLDVTVPRPASSSVRPAGA